MADVHKRMPVILAREDERLWLEAEGEELQLLDGLLRPYPAGAMSRRMVSTLVNSPRNDSATVLQLTD